MVSAACPISDNDTVLQLPVTNKDRSPSRGPTVSPDALMVWGRLMGSSTLVSHRLPEVHLPGFELSRGSPEQQMLASAGDGDFSLFHRLLTPSLSHTLDLPLAAALEAL
jgi:hypothetical protein